MKAPWAGVMNGPRHQFLSRAAVACNQHRGIGGRHRFNRVEHLLHRGALADDVFRTRDFRHCLPQAHVFLLRSLVRECVLHQVRDVIGIEGLGDVVVGAVFQSSYRCLYRRVAGHHNYREARIDFVHAALQFNAVGAAHLDVHQRYVPALLGNASQRVIGILRGAHLKTLFVKPLAQRIAHAEFIVHDQHFSLVGQFNHLACVPAVSGTSTRGFSSCRGRLTTKVVPFPISDFTSIFPLCRSMMLRLTARPSPTPCPLSFVVRKGSNIRGRSSGAIPTPSSRTSNSISCVLLLSRVFSQRLPPRGSASIAFITKASSTCSICAPSHCAGGSPSAISSCS